LIKGQRFLCEMMSVKIKAVGKGTKCWCQRTEMRKNNGRLLQNDFNGNVIIIEHRRQNIVKWNKSQWSKYNLFLFQPRARWVFTNAIFHNTVSSKTFSPNSSSQRNVKKIKSLASTLIGHVIYKGERQGHPFRVKIVNNYWLTHLNLTSESCT